MRNAVTLLILLIFSLACSEGRQTDTDSATGKPQLEYTRTATLAGGCFWCMEAPFEGLDGIVNVVSGYSGGKEIDPTYEEVSSGKTGHLEVVQIAFNPRMISYQELLDIYWKQFDPTDAGGSFTDRGSQYRSAIFYHSEDQLEVARASKNRLDKSGKFNDPIVTELTEFQTFYPAEDYHQDYFRKNPKDYKSYRKGSGRDRFISEYWEIPSADKYPRPKIPELKERLSPMEFEVTMEDGTEPPFKNPFHDKKDPGIYVDKVSGAPLFSSADKYDSKTGWPSFTRPIDARYLDKIANQDFTEVEVRSKFGDAHLGHIFNDGPEPTGLRYCINSAALTFIPKEEMKDREYGSYFWLVD